MQMDGERRTAQRKAARAFAAALHFGGAGSTSSTASTADGSSTGGTKGSVDSTADGGADGTGSGSGGEDDLHELAHAVRMSQVRVHVHACVLLSVSYHPVSASLNMALTHVHVHRHALPATVTPVCILQATRAQLSMATVACSAFDKRPQLVPPPSTET